MTRKADIFLSFFLALCLSIVLIIIAIKITIFLKPIYYFDIKLYNLEAVSGLSTDKIKETYNYILSFLTDSRIQNFNLPNFDISYNAIIHFYEVKKLFQYIDGIFYISLILCVIISLILPIHTKQTFFKASAVILLSLIFNFLLKFSMDFDKSFTEFHNIFFRNDFWLFDPKLDPVINILPEGFFFHCAVLMLLILLLDSLLLIIIYKKKAVKPL